MTLTDDLRAGFKALNQRDKNDYQINDELDKSGWASITLPYKEAPVRLRDDELVIQVRLSDSGRFFSLYSPVALINGTLKASAYEHFLRRQFYADQVGGAGIAIQDINEMDVVTVVAHWSVGHITPEDFVALYDVVMQAVFTVVDEVAVLVEKGQPLRPMHG